MMRIMSVFSSFADIMSCMDFPVFSSFADNIMSCNVLYLRCS